jgi:hypothetical protein
MGRPGDEVWGGAAGGDTPLETSQIEFAQEEERLPWLETGEDDLEEADGSTGRLIGLVFGVLVLLAVTIGGIWGFVHRGGGSGAPEGSIIHAPSQPYKMVPANPGGKPMAGTGDTSYAVSEGQTRTPHLNEQSPDTAPALAESCAAAPTAVSGNDASAGGGVQVAAYGSRDKAEAGWNSLVQQSEALKGLHHRVIEGSADIGTVYRLQAVTGDQASAHALCARLRSESIACQVK